MHMPTTSRLAVGAGRSTRRKLLQTTLLGGIALLSAACGSTTSQASTSLTQKSITSSGQPGAVSAGPGVAVGRPSSLAAPKSRPAVAIAPTTLPPPTTVPTTIPVASSTPEPTAVPPPSPTTAATTVPYNAARVNELLGQSITSYAGSIASRAHNVRRATDLVNGATVAPGAVFSFDAQVGDQSVANGFTVAYGIINVKGVPKTVPAIAGGICQVATTLFQSVYWAGLPIVRHYHHLYWIAHYGQPPYGQVGLDATVDFLPVDFAFRNTTSDWLRIEGAYDSTHVHFRVYGVDPGWKVTSSPTKVTNVVKTDRATVRQEDPSQPAGYELWIEEAEDGFDATIERLVTKNGQTVDRYLFTNHYEPARNVLAVGTKGAKPTAVPTNTPIPVSPTVAPPATPMAKPTAPPTPIVYVLPDGQVRVPSLVGMPEAQAKALVSNVSLQNTYTNYQGQGSVPDQNLKQVAVGAVLSQNPTPGSIVPKGTTIYLAVRKN